MRFAHTNIVSINWKELADFYVKTFNCKIIPKGAHLLLPGYGENGPTLEIYQYEIIEEQDFVKPNKRGFGHIAFEVDSVEGVLQNLKDNGGKISGEITRRTVEGVGEITFVYARDPEGNLIELQSWK